ncbi:hypothetical protein HPB51_004396 [Rhipicephalus microplus]|uniref:Transmembrane protein n=1 Tax=Rhipicephalus microplus TaxID=6941 RepID=A0A9J6EKX9_RHIMP|nr:hypothetical protein HPB51_004396 [Rhipicephalus microplus]
MCAVRRSPSRRVALVNLEDHASSRRLEGVAESPPCAHRGRRDKFCAGDRLQLDDAVNSSCHHEVTELLPPPLFNCTAAVCTKGQWQHCDAEFIDDGIRLTRDEWCLNGPKRLVAEGFLSPRDCSQITRNVALHISPSTLDVANLVLASSSKIRRYAEAYFALRSPLSFHTTRLECRGASSRKPSADRDEQKSSETVHCDRQMDGACLQRNSHTKWQNYRLSLSSAEVNLVTIVVGREEVMQNSLRPDLSVVSLQAVVPAKCGRAVIAASDQPHSYRPLPNAKGCRLVLGFTHAALQRDRSREALQTAVYETRRRLRDRRQPGSRSSHSTSTVFFVRRLNKHAPVSYRCRVMIVLGGIMPILACYVCFFSVQYHNHLYPHRRLDFARVFNKFVN